MLILQTIDTLRYVTFASKIHVCMYATYCYKHKYCERFKFAGSTYNNCTYNLTAGKSMRLNYRTYTEISWNNPWFIVQEPTLSNGSHTRCKIYISLFRRKNPERHVKTSVQSRKRVGNVSGQMYASSYTKCYKIHRFIYDIPMTRRPFLVLSRNIHVRSAVRAKIKAFSFCRRYDRSDLSFESRRESELLHARENKVSRNLLKIR